MRYSILHLCLLTVLGISSQIVINERDNGLRLECNYVADSNGNIEEALHYYPFGMLMAESVNTTLQPYKYNGKELYRMHGLDWYDYGARMYDSKTIRWTTPDQLAEDYYETSPYVYCLNNPVNAIDLDGRKNYRLNKDGWLTETSPTLFESFMNFFGFSSNEDRISLEETGELLMNFTDGTINLSRNDKNTTILNIKDNTNAEEFFNIVAKKTDVEWARIVYTHGSSSDNVLINNHKDEDVSSSYSIAKMLESKGANIKIYNHSHPIPKDLKYGNLSLFGASNPPSKTDINTASKFKNVTFGVYSIIDNKIFYYNENGVYKIKEWY